jgi:hypothetical protein
MRCGVRSPAADEEAGYVTEATGCGDGEIRDGEGIGGAFHKN